MAEQLGRADLILGTDDRELKRGVSTAHRAARGLERQFRATALSLAGLATAALSLRSVTRFARESIQAFKAQEEADASLRAALQVTGKTGAEAFDLISKQASALQKVTTKADEALIQASSTLALLAPSLNAAELAKAQEAMIGIADTFLKGDVNNAAALLGKTLASTTNALTRYGIQVDMSASQGDRLRQVLSQTNSMFQVSLERANTLAGLTERLAKAWDDLKEAIGKVLATRAQLGQFLDQLRKVVESITQTIAEGTGPEIRDMFETIGKIAALGFVTGFVRGFREVQNVLRDMITPEILEPAFDFLANVAGGFLADKTAQAFSNRINELFRELLPGVQIGDVFNPLAPAATGGGGGGQFRPPLPLGMAVDRLGRDLREQAQPEAQLRRGLIDMTDAFSEGGRFWALPDLDALENLNTFSRRLADNFQNVGNIMANQFVGGLTSAIFGLQSFGDALRNFVLQLAQQAVGGFIRSLIPLPGFSVAPVPVATGVGGAQLSVRVEGDNLQGAALDAGIYASNPQLQRFLIASLQTARFGGFRG